MSVFQIRRMHLKFVWFTLVCVLGFTGCARKPVEKAEEAQNKICRELSGTPWIPKSSQLSKTVSPDPVFSPTSTFQFVTEQFHFSAPVVGAAQGFSSDNTVTFEFEMQEPVGAGGELSLTAHTPLTDAELSENFRPDTVHPLLISLWDGKHEWVGVDSTREADESDVARADDCRSKGFLKIRSDGSAATRSGCLPISKKGSAFLNPSQWFSRQFGLFGSVSFNQFPTCDWSGEGCYFPDRLFQEPHELRSGPGVKYRATYLLLNSALAKVERDVRVGLHVSVQKKITLPHLRPRSELPQSGQFDLNVILVGQGNIQASRTDAGKRTLQALLEQLQSVYQQANVNIRIGKTQALEWHCDNGGEAFAVLPVGRIGRLFETGSRLTPEAEASSYPALNLFLVETILLEDENSLLSLRGLAGGIGGPLIPGTRSSGVVIATDGVLTELDAHSSRVAREQLGDAITHEIGHFLGLSHLSERDGKKHDAIPDTPECRNTETLQEMELITDRSCKKDSTPLTTTGKTCAELCPRGGKKCPAVEECAFNHVMWWVEKDYRVESSELKGDGNLFSPLSGRLLRYSPFVY